MKKILLASTVVLSMAGFAKSAVYAEESQVTKKPQTTDVLEKKEESAPKKEVPQVDTRKDSVVKEKDPAKEDISNKEKNKESEKEGWLKEQGSWRFYENNQPVLDWKQIDNKWYYFNKEGVMISNIIIDDYLIQDNGALAKNTWVKISDKWYYATASGKISRNKWGKIAGIWYYFDKEGAMVTNTLVGDYLIQNSGALAENTWVKISNKWYYATASGKISRNKWEKIKGIWYYFDIDGVMLSNQWRKDYYLKDSGAMAEKEWIFDNSYNSWFYLKTGGAYASREWSGSYYLKTGGYMAKNEWIFDKDYDAWYYLKEDGMYVTGSFNIKGKEYSFQNNGKWISESKYYKVKPITAYVYSSSGEKLSYVSQGTIVSFGDTEAPKNTQIPVNISGLKT